eukprot:m.35689 g.35689  ORF g.35689 m.35689 type:complete len:380 (-) comp12418_c0_seq1:41-1180(-)
MVVLKSRMAAQPMLRTFRQTVRRHSTSMQPTARAILHEYKPAAWMDVGRLSEVAPKHRLQLSQAPTPLQRWLPFPTRHDTALFIKRDDLTHGTGAGNKIRKLEFLLAEALANSATDIITCGGVQSNHCRTTAILARELGLQPHLVLRSHETCVETLPSTGNLFLNQLLGCHLHLVPKGTPYEPGLRSSMEDIKALLASKDRVGYAIPVGGSNIAGLFGYLEGFAELHAQCQSEGVTDITVTCGSGGTACGLALANRLLGNPYRIWAVAICDNRQYFYQHVQDTLDELALPYQAKDLLTVIDGFKGDGYGEFGKNDVKFIRSVAMQSGVVLDPTYTGKGARALQTMLWTLKTLRGSKMVFVHTGGVFGLMDGRLGSHDSK